MHAASFRDYTPEEWTFISYKISFMLIDLLFSDIIRLVFIISRLFTINLFCFPSTIYLVYFLFSKNLSCTFWFCRRWMKPSGWNSYSKWGQRFWSTFLGWMYWNSICRVIILKCFWSGCDLELRFFIVYYHFINLFFYCHTVSFPTIILTCIFNIMFSGNVNATSEFRM